jgi:hypothetical protein
MAAEKIDTDFSCRRLSLQMSIHYPRLSNNANGGCRREGVVRAPTDNGPLAANRSRAQTGRSGFDPLEEDAEVLVEQDVGVEQIVRRATFHAPFIFPSTSSRQPERSG